MKRCVPFALLFACSTLTAIAQPDASREGPLVSLYLPRGFPSEKVELRYFLIGPFGGYGSFIGPESDRQTLDIVAAVKGRAAESVKIVAYLPGCEIIKLEIVPAGTATWRQLECRPLANITLHGRVPLNYASTKNEIAVSYQAEWTFDFFGIRDGMILSIPLSRAKFDENGQFAIEVPDFYQQKLGRGSYLLGLHCTHCTTPSDLNPRELPVAASYPPVIEFTSQ
jgi:hypothetical protein